MTSVSVGGVFQDMVLLPSTTLNNTERVSAPVFKRIKKSARHSSVAADTKKQLKCFLDCGINEQNANEKDGVQFSARQRKI